MTTRRRSTRTAGALSSPICDSCRSRADAAPRARPMRVLGKLAIRLLRVSCRPSEDTLDGSARRAADHPHPRRPEPRRRVGRRAVAADRVRPAARARQLAARRQALAAHAAADRARARGVSPVARSRAGVVAGSRALLRRVRACDADDPRGSRSAPARGEARWRMECRGPRPGRPARGRERRRHGGAGRRADAARGPGRAPRAHRRAAVLLGPERGGGRARARVLQVHGGERMARDPRLAQSRAEGARGVSRTRRLQVTPEHYRRASQIFLAACALDREARASFLERECRGDQVLRAEVESLLESDAEDAEFVDAAAAGGGADLLARDVALLAEQQPAAEIAGFTLVRKIGEGGMGSVWEARQSVPRRTVALKLIRGIGSGHAARRFEREAELLGRLQHPGIAHVYQAGVASVRTPAGEEVEQRYLAMELID